MKNGCVIVNEIEVCAIATHFNELFLDYCEKYHPGFYKQIIAQDKASSSDTTIKNAIYSINIDALFVDWLNK